MSSDVTPVEMKRFIIETLALEDVEPEDIGDEEPLFAKGIEPGSMGLGLDSIDGLELDIALRKRFNLDSEEGQPAIRDHLSTVSTLVAFLSTRSQSC